MTDNNNSQPANPENGNLPKSRREYTAPELIEYGKIDRLTGGGSSGRVEKGKGKGKGKGLGRKRA